MACHRLLGNVLGVLGLLGGCQGEAAREAGSGAAQTGPRGADDDAGSVATGTGLSADDAVLGCASGVLNNQVEAHIDADGDGLGAESDAGTRRFDVCEGDSLPSGFAMERGDCDDADPKVFRRACVDRDGDGAEVPVCAGTTLAPGQTACRSVLDWIPGSGPHDCDDGNAQRKYLYYRDLDGDGRGAGEAVCSLPGPGWSPFHDDCDDGDARRTPYAYDVWGDGADPDCDGTDGGPCASLATFAAFDGPDAISDRCDGPRLALGVLDCSVCSQQVVTLAIENRGPTRVQAELEIVSGEDRSATPPYRLVFSVDLAAGERKAIVSGPFVGRFELRYVPPATTDCYPADNWFAINSGHCL